MQQNDLTSLVQEQVQSAFINDHTLNICAGKSKNFYGRTACGEMLDLSGHRGIIHYAPEELVITARSGTPLIDIELALAEQQQMLAFEPPSFTEATTIGGTVATGLSGPRRPYAGSVRDFVLGMKLINGKSEILKFGGEVMKNVAGYDVSRLQTGALGTMGVLLDISLKVLPRPAEELTLAYPLTLIKAHNKMLNWISQPLPISATAWSNNQLYVRLSGQSMVIDSVKSQLGGQLLEENAKWWQALRDHKLEYFQTDQPLWRISLPATTAELPLAGEWLYEWNGALRWLRSDVADDEIRRVVADAGGHATLFRGGDRDAEIFHPLNSVMAQLQQRIKQSFDPKGILNPGRMYASL